jgi:hypothetical protein
MSEPRELIEECRAALAEELAAWDIDPPLHHVKQAHDKCVAWLAENGPELSIEDYNARAIPRLAAIDALSAKIDFTNFAWRNTPEGERWQALMDAQGRDEAAAGI